tara:strand:+ start:281 stop:1099 length:819 start_codon:yes stop_codon:yes gene_type:complete
MPRHNKKRNTAFLYEMLVREVVKQSISKETSDRDEVISILKECFKAGSEISKELKLYKNLLETKNLSPNIAEKLIQESKKQYKKLDKDKIFNEQSSVIKKINKKLSKNVFSNFVPNYKDLATLSQIFDDDITAKRRVILEENLLNKLIFKENKDSSSKAQTSNLIVKKFIEKFNTKYKSFLNENQKQLLNKYILSFKDNGVDFKFFLNEEIGRLKKEVDKSFFVEEIKKDTTIFSKMERVKSILEGFGKKPILEEDLEQILKIQKLIHEVKN